MGSARFVEQVAAESWAADAECVRRGRQSKAACGDCRWRTRRDCLAWAVTLRDDPGGFVGGFSSDERRVIRAAAWMVAVQVMARKHLYPLRKGDQVEDDALE